MLNRTQMFDTREEAQSHFSGIDVEMCECCGQWTASRADDYDEGGIVGACVMPNGDTPYDRICMDCDEGVDLESMHDHPII